MSSVSSHTLELGVVFKKIWNGQRLQYKMYVRVCDSWGLLQKILESK